MTDTIEAKDLEANTSNMETNSALPPEETERLTTEIIAGHKSRQKTLLIPDMDENEFYKIIEDLI